MDKIKKYCKKYESSIVALVISLCSSLKLTEYIVLVYNYIFKTNCKVQDNPTVDKALLGVLFTAGLFFYNSKSVVTVGFYKNSNPKERLSKFSIDGRKVKKIILKIDVVLTFKASKKDRIIVEFPDEIIVSPTKESKSKYFGKNEISVPLSEINKHTGHSSITIECSLSMGDMSTTSHSTPVVFFEKKKIIKKSIKYKFQLEMKE